MWTKPSLAAGAAMMLAAGPAAAQYYQGPYIKIIKCHIKGRVAVRRASMVAAFPIKGRIVVRRELMDGEATGTTPDRPLRRMPITTRGDTIAITGIESRSVPADGGRCGLGAAEKWD